MTRLAEKASLLKAIAGDPLAHFAAFGLLALGAMQLLGGVGDREPVAIGEARERALRAAWETQSGSPPSDEEVAALIRDAEEEEILYREALLLGIDRNDEIVRRRLAQKMRFLIEDDVAFKEPTEAELRDHFETYSDRFQPETNLDFEQVFFNETGDGKEAPIAAVAALARLRSGNADATRLGESSLLPPRHTNRSRARVDADFGNGFFDKIEGLTLGEWSGPLRSAFGWHLVRVATRHGTGKVSFEEVRSAVRAEFMEQRRNDAIDAEMNRLRQAYGLEAANSDD